MRILLTGSSGQVGQELLALLGELGVVSSPGRTELDLASEDSIIRAVRRFRPQVIVNPGAYTNVNEAESHAELAHSINARAPGLLAELARQMNAILIHYSTDYVFDGTKSGAWLESDATGPQNVYGASKLAGERNITAVGGRFVILRTSWVYSLHGNNFLRTISRLAAERTELRVVRDQIGAPTSAQQIASATTVLIKGFAGIAFGGFPGGTYHLTAAGSTSWSDFASSIVDLLRERMPLKVQRIVPISSEEFPSPAARPLNSILNNAKFAQTFGFQLVHWKLGLQEVMQQWCNNSTCG